MDKPSPKIVRILSLSKKGNMTKFKTSKRSAIDVKIAQLLERLRKAATGISIIESIRINDENGKINIINNKRGNASPTDVRLPRGVA